MGVFDIPGLVAAQKRLRGFADRERGKFLLRFFKTGLGEYAEGDRFLGIRVPDLRTVAREFRSLSLRDLQRLLASKWHEERLLALVILVDQYARASDTERDAIYRLYLASTKDINNWDLVDVSAPRIVGAHLLRRDRRILHRLARSKSVWERRIALGVSSTTVTTSSIRPPAGCFAKSQNAIRSERCCGMRSRGFLPPYGRGTSRHSGCSI